MSQTEVEHCEICGAVIEDGAFTVVALTEPPRPVPVCKGCASGQYVSVPMSGLQVKIERDDYLRSEGEDLEEGIAQAETALADHGWELEGLTVRKSRS